jgi:hypothetical protein
VWTDRYGRVGRRGSVGVAADYTNVLVFRMDQLRAQASIMRLGYLIMQCLGLDRVASVLTEVKS